MEQQGELFAPNDPNPIPRKEPKWKAASATDSGDKRIIDGSLATDHSLWDGLPRIDKKTSPIQIKALPPILPKFKLNEEPRYGSFLETIRFQKVELKSPEATWYEWCLIDGDTLIREWYEP